MESETKAIDIATYILHKTGPISAMKLQKLLYYSQAWSLAWNEESMFPERIEAWANGPVVPDIYQMHRGAFKVQESDFAGNPNILSDMQKNVVERVLDFYGQKDPQWLSELTHLEDPWKDARTGLSAGERGNTEISQASMAEYYASL